MSPPNQRLPSGFIANLCLAHAHRWQPERMFVILTAYFDESGTHAGSPVTVVGAVMANALQWRRFEQEFRRLKRSHGFEIFHTKKFRKGTGDFKGWSREQKLALLAGLSEITRTKVMEGVVMTIDNEEYDRDFRSGNNKGLRLDSKYGFCFRECLLHLLRDAKRRERASNVPELHLVLEAGHENAGDAVRIYNETKADLRLAGYDALKSVTLAEKDECDPLMLADSLAHIAYVRECQALEGHIPSPRVAGYPGISGISYIHYDTGLLGEVKRDFASTRYRPRKATDLAVLDS